MREPDPKARRWAYAAIIVGVIAIAAAAFGLGRSSAPRATASPGSTSPASTGVAQSAGTGSGWPGATRLENGVPLGYAHTQEGAVQAATNFDQVLGSAEFLLHPDKYRSAVHTMAAPSWHVDPENRLASFAPSITAATQGKTVVERPFEISYHVDSYHDSTARITLLTGLLATTDGVGTPVIGVSGESYALTWLGDWRVSDQGTAYTPGLQLANPAPQTNQMLDGLKQSTGGYSYAPRS